MSSVLESDYPNLEVIFFDNGSTDGSVAFVKQRLKTDAKLRIIAIPNNCGPAEGNNKAVEFTKGKYVVLLNNDVEVESGSIRELVEAMESDSAIGIAHSKIMFFDRLHIQTVGNLLDLTLDTHMIGCNEEDKGQYDSIFEPTFPSGACMILRRSMIERIGLFDPNYFFYHDDCDIGLRARLAGFKIVYIPSSIVFHKGESTVSSYAKRNEIMCYFINSRMGLLVKNLEFRSILRIGIPLLVRNSLDIYNLLKQGAITVAIRSAFWGLVNFKNDWKRRQIMQKNMRRISDGELFKYFLDYSYLLSQLKSTHPLRWLVRPQNNLAKSVKLLTYAYYRDHKSPPLMKQEKNPTSSIV